jgi:hypothetical protein
VAPPTGSTCGVGDLFFYQITTSLTNPVYTLLNLPPGLSVSPTGLISGRPGEAGVFNVTIYATDGNCRAHANLVITITPAPAEDLDIFPPETQSTTLTITGREFNYNNVYTVPVQAIPNQIVRFSASGQAVVLHIYQRLYGIFMDVSVMASGNNVVTILGGVLCEDRNLIVRSMYFNFNGDFAFVDTLGTSNPHYTELGTRYLLVYLEPPATTGVTPTTGMVTTTGIGLTMVTGTMTGS